MIPPGRYTSGRIALANLSAEIESLERRRAQRATFEELERLATLLFIRGDVLGRIADHDRAEQVTNEAALCVPDIGTLFYARSRLAERFHRFDEASRLLQQAQVAGYPQREIDTATAALRQAVGKYDEALVLRARLAKEDRRLHTLGALASLLAEMGQWARAEACYRAALEADTGSSPLPCSQLLFEWAVSAMRSGELDRAEKIFGGLQSVLPEHVPGRGHRAEVALARGQLNVALTLIAPLVETSDDPEYRAVYAEILEARGERETAAIQVQLATARYEELLARRPEAYADHAASFFMGIGACAPRAVDLARLNLRLRDTPRSRRLLLKALVTAQRAAACPLRKQIA